MPMDSITVNVVQVDVSKKLNSTKEEKKDQWYTDVREKIRTHFINSIHQTAVILSPCERDDQLIFLQEMCSEDESSVLHQYEVNDNCASSKDNSHSIYIYRYDPTFTEKKIDITYAIIPPESKDWRKGEIMNGSYKWVWDAKCRNMIFYGNAIIEIIIRQCYFVAQ